MYQNNYVYADRRRVFPVYTMVDSKHLEVHFDWRNVRGNVRWIQKVFGICIPVCQPVFVERDSDRKNDPIHLEFSRNDYALRKINCIVFGLHCINRECTGIHKTTRLFSI